MSTRAVQYASSFRTSFSVCAHRKTRTFKKLPKRILQMHVGAQKNPIHNHATRPHRLGRRVLMPRGDRRKPLCLSDLC